MTALEAAVGAVYLGAAACFVLGLHLMNAPPTARRGNALSAGGMAAALLATLVLVAARGAAPAAWAVIAAGTAIGAGAGLFAALRVRMTAMPQLVSLFNAVGGGAAALIGGYEFGARPDPGTAVAAVIAVDVVIGTAAFSGSLVAAGKLDGRLPGRPVLLPARAVLTALLALTAAVGAVLVAAGTGGAVPLAVAAAAALLLGVAGVLAIGGADMPVVVSLLNACTGLAVAMAGFALDNSMMVIAGALVGASGAILTKLMADAMNRPLSAVVAGGFGTGDGGPAAGGGGDVQRIGADDAAIRLAYAARVVMVPGYGLAAAQAQHELRELADLLAERGVRVDYAVHPVAGRMPGHMNVLLAEAKVPYERMKEMEQANPDFPRTDVALVVGANDVTNPAARRPGTAISGMPILDVDKAETVIVIKRSLGHGYAGIDNELYTAPGTRMLLGDAKEALASLTGAVKALVG
ncbi:NAD(P)(+) transhydrogenase (Re/Si-specific) subunit beta [Nocardiopsis suaedae]|uniref:NAD(P) transhydrogenase subunit beta n=1 Tax=Nocardiopsis suaedae TaxID=3018444 RepID=A0ABT4TG50_9ACTN|nr:NAD(P)(+) transhydrogenase (Re/Si-specific) subunit beta [Nocardiopsis suaedae]MDA2803097.1 NAD(P)(+) transhydrogenase (Re/Si-specific) subunit beta [Nocardiopsis suaedae]